MKTKSSSKEKLNKSIKLFLHLLIAITVLYFIFTLFRFTFYKYTIIFLSSLYIWKQTDDNIIFGLLFAYCSFVIINFLDIQFNYDVNSTKTDLPEKPVEPTLPPPKSETDDTTPQKDFTYYDVPYLMKNDDNFYYYYKLTCDDVAVKLHQSTNTGYDYLFQFEKINSKYNSNRIYYSDEAIISTASNEICPKRYFIEINGDLRYTTDKKQATVFKLGKSIVNSDENVKYESYIHAKTLDSTALNYDYIFIITRDRNFI